MDRINLLIVFEVSLSLDPSDVQWRDVFRQRGQIVEPSGRLWETLKVIFIVSVIILFIEVPVWVISSFAVVMFAFSPHLIDDHKVEIDKDFLLEYPVLYFVGMLILAKLTFSQALSGYKGMRRVNLDFFFLFQTYTTIMLTISLVSIFFTVSKMVPSVFLGIELALLVLTFAIKRMVERINDL